MRTRTSRLAATAAFAAALLPAVIARGQIDKRVNTGNDTSGRLHDANGQVGSGGVNLARPTYDTGGRSDAIDTGNVTGLGRFHGPSPLLQNNAFRASLGSTTLSSFQRQSVGLTEALGNQAYTPGYYYDTQRTIGDVGTIRQGLNMPGSSVLATPYAMPARAGGVGERPTALGIRDPRDRRIGVGVDPNTLGSYRVDDNVAATSFTRSIRTPAAFDSAVGSSIFGPPAPTTPHLLDALAERRAARRELVGRLANDLQRERLREELDRRDRGIASPARAPAPTSPEEIPPSIASIEVVGAVNPAGKRETANHTADAYSGMLRALQASQADGKAAAGFRAPSRASAAAAEQSEPGNLALGTKSAAARIGTKREVGHRAEEIKGSSADRQAAAVTGKWGLRSVDDAVTTFAGEYADRFNQCMANGEEELHNGRFYNAARQFELANVIDSENPLPLLARGHALAAAGDYVSAVDSLTRGIDRFPQIAAFKLDFNALVGQTDVFDRRRADLERHLTQRDDAELRFLLGYLELYSGLTDSAQKNLDSAAKHAPPGSVIARFPDLIFGRMAIPPPPKMAP